MFQRNFFFYAIIHQTKFNLSKLNQKILRANKFYGGTFSDRTWFREISAEMLLNGILAIKLTQLLRKQKPRKAYANMFRLKQKAQLYYMVIVS